VSEHPHVLGDVVGRALAAAAEERDRHAHLWRMTREERVAAFYRGDLSFGDCLAWACRYPKEPPVAADGEWLFIAVTTPEWADEPSSLPLESSREL